MGNGWNRKPNGNSGDYRKAMVSGVIKASTEISQLIRNDGWQRDGAYLTELMGHIVEICMRYGIVPTLSHLATALHVSKEVIDDVRTGYIKANPDVVEAVTQYYQLCESATVAATMNGAINNIAGIFALKSQYGYKEEPREVIMTHNKLVGERKDPKAIAERYRDATVVDAIETRQTEDDFDF